MVDRGIFDKTGVNNLFVDPRVSSQVSMKGHTMFLPQTFQPGNWDVICHTGREAQEHGKSSLADLIEYVMLIVENSFS